MRQIHRQLRAAQKPRRGVSLYSRFVNRPLGRLFAALAIRVGISPNQVTACSAVVTAVGITVIAAAGPSTWSAFAIATCLVIGFALDSADGQVARYTKTGGPRGEWLDHVVDAGKTVTLHGAVLISWFRYQGVSGSALLIPLAFQAVAVVTFVAGTLSEVLGRATLTRDRQPSWLRSILLLPADFGVLALSFFVWGWSDFHRSIYAVLLACNSVLMVILLGRWWRALRMNA